AVRRSTEELLSTPRSAGATARMCQPHGIAGADLNGGWLARSSTIFVMPDLVFPTPPTFATIDEERQYRKQRLAAGFRLFSRFGFDEGVAGHITARDPELSDHFWVNPFAMHFGHIKVSDLLLVNHMGEVVEGRHPVNTAAFAIHSQIHAARPD